MATEADFKLALVDVRLVELKAEFARRRNFPHNTHQQVEAKITEAKIEALEAYAKELAPD